MPCIEMSLPESARELRAPIARAITDAFSAVTGHPAEIVGVRFFEYREGEAFVGGRPGPYFHMLVYSPRLKRSVKQKLASALAEAVTRASGHETWRPTIHLCEHPYDNVVVDGQLLSDAFEACAKKPFYYELPKD